MSCALQNPSPSPCGISLRELPKGRKARVFRLEGEPVACQRLREMGFCEKAEVKVLNNHGPVICQVCGSKVGLSKEIADAVFVEPVTTAETVA